MMKKYLLLLSLTVIFQISLMGQQDPHYTHWRYNKILLNPAYAGASGKFCLNGIAHRQWIGYDDQSWNYPTQDPNKPAVSDNISKNIAPKTNGLGFSAPVNIKNSSGSQNYGGLFAAFITDEVAYEKTTYLRFGLAGNIPLGANGSAIRLGMDFTSLTKQLDGDKLRAHQNPDPLIPTGQSSDNGTTLGAGIYYTNPDINNLYVGLSSTHLNPKTFSFGTGGTTKVTTARHYYLMAGMDIENFMGNPALEFEPGILLKTTNDKGGFVKPEVDLQGMVTWSNMFAGGVNLRAYGFGFDAFSLMLGYYPPLKNGNGPNANQQLRIGYSYDITISTINKVSSGTHELQVNYCFPISLPDRPDRIWRHPTYMDIKPKLK